MPRKNKIEYPIEIEKCTVSIPGVLEPKTYAVYCLPREVGEPNRFGSITKAKEAWRKHLSDVQTEERLAYRRQVALNKALRRMIDGLEAMYDIHTDSLFDFPEMEMKKIFIDATAKMEWLSDEMSKAVRS